MNHSVGRNLVGVLHAFDFTEDFIRERHYTAHAPIEFDGDFAFNRQPDIVAPRSGAPRASSR